MSPLFTILLPIVRPPVMLPFAIESVLAQSIPEFELFVICDGAPPETVACARDYARLDARVKVFPFPKGQGHGETHRHTVLGGAAGRNVAQIADDDLWFPDHLAELEILLSKADFGNLLQVFLHPNGRAEILPGDIGLSETRQRMLNEKFNLFGPTVAGYRLGAYRQLPEGWAPAPTHIWSDLHMWRKFLRMESFVFATRAKVTAVVFATPHWVDTTLEQRHDENRAYLERIRDPGKRDEIVQEAWHSLVAAKEDEIKRILQSRSWRLTAPLRRCFAIVRRFGGATATRPGR
jgi:succinoglycan biosynthesis protein ExoW